MAFAIALLMHQQQHLEVTPFIFSCICLLHLKGKLQRISLYYRHDEDHKVCEVFARVVSLNLFKSLVLQVCLPP